VLDLGGISLNDETTAGFSGRLDSARLVSIRNLSMTLRHLPGEFSVANFS